MVSNSRGKAIVAAATFLLWAGAAASAVYWGMKLSNGGELLPPPAAPRTAPPIDPLTVAKLLGSSPAATPAAAAPPSLASRFNLLGVVAGGAKGAALIAVDGKPAKPYRVGAAVDEGLVVQSVEARRVALGPEGGAPSVTLELPLRK